MRPWGWDRPIVADSNAGDEWRECLAKGAFVTAGARPFDLIETMRFDPLDGIADLERHLARMKRIGGGARLRLRSPRRAQRVAGGDLPPARGRAGVRLLLAPQRRDRDRDARRCPPPPAGPVEVAIAPLPVAPPISACATRPATAPSTTTPAAPPARFEVVFVDARRASSPKAASPASSSSATAGCSPRRCRAGCCPACCARG